MITVREKIFFQGQGILNCSGNLGNYAFRKVREFLNNKSVNNKNIKKKG